MASLFNISEEFNTLYELANEIQYDEDGNIIDSSDILSDIFNELENDLVDKLDATNYIIKELKANEQALKDEAKRLTDKAKALANKQERLKQIMKSAIEVSGNAKLKGKFSYSITQRESYNYDDVSLFGLDEEFIRTKQELDKNKIKDFVKAGGTIDGLKVEAATQLNIR